MQQDFRIESYEDFEKDHDWFLAELGYAMRM